MEESGFFSDTHSATSQTEGYGNFKLLKETAYARIWIADRDGKRFLVKTAKDNSEMHLRLLRREYELSIGCDHPHIVHVYTYETELPVGAGIIMEYVEGRTLAEFLRENPPAKERKRLFLQLLSAIAYLHKRGVVHNDIKPDNILISSTESSLKVIDFGLSDKDSHYALKSLGCTPRYASPELMAQSASTDARSDIYSIGVLMEEMLGPSRIANRCKRNLPEKRFANIGELQQAWSNRHRPWKIALAAIAILAIALPTTLYISLRMDIAKEEQNTTTLLDELNSKIVRICENTGDSIAASPYMEFANVHLLRMWEECNDLKNEVLSKTSDAKLQAALATHHGQIYLQYYLQYIDSIAKLPLYRTCVGYDEALFYDSLIENRQPYRKP
jgi:serine/threonine protein kinase